MNFKELKKCMDRICDETVKNQKGEFTPDPIMIRGKHGIGKSECVQQFAKSRGLELIEKRLIHFSAGDFSGIPKIDGEWTTWCPPDFLVKASKQPVVLFLDEFDRGAKNVRQNVMQLGDSRQLNGVKLHPGTILISAMNGGPTNTHYQVNDLDQAESSRWWICDFEPSVEEWLDWAKNNCWGVICDFIKNSPHFLEHEGEFQSGVVVPCRRSWKRFSDKLRSEDFKPENVDFIYSLGLGYVGVEASSAFHKYVKSYQFVITPEQILSRERFEELEGLNMSEHSEIIERFVTRKIFHQELTSSQMRNLGDYCELLPSSELFILMFHLMQPSMDSENCKKNVVEFLQLYTRKDNKGYNVWVAESFTGIDSNEDITEKAKSMVEKSKEPQISEVLEGSQDSEDSNVPTCEIA